MQNKVILLFLLWFRCIPRHYPTQFSKDEQERLSCASSIIVERNQKGKGTKNYGFFGLL